MSFCFINSIFSRWNFLSLVDVERVDFEGLIETLNLLGRNLTVFSVVDIYCYESPLAFFLNLIMERLMRVVRNWWEKGTEQCQAIFLRLFLRLPCPLRGYMIVDSKMGITPIILLKRFYCYCRFRFVCMCCCLNGELLRCCASRRQLFFFVVSSFCVIFYSLLFETKKKWNLRNEMLYFFSLRVIPIRRL